MNINKWMPVFEKEGEGAGGGSVISDAGTTEDTSAISGAGEPVDEPVGEPAADEPLTTESITFPEGIEVDAETLTPFLELMNNSELTRTELAQKIVDLQIKTAQEGDDAATKAAQTLWSDTQTQWQNETKALPKLGGDKLDESLATIKSGLIKAGATDAFFEALNVTGAGNHPEIFKVLFNLTKTHKEGGPVSGTPTSGKLSQAEKMFG